MTLPWHPSLLRRIFIPIVFANIAVWLAVLGVNILNDAAIDVRARNEQVHAASTLLERQTNARDAISFTMALASFNEWSPKIPILIELWEQDGKRLYVNQKQVTFWYAPLIGDPNRITRTLANGKPYNVFRHDGTRWSLRVAIPQAPQSRFEILAEYTMESKFFFALMISFSILMPTLWLAIGRGLAPLQALSQKLAHRTVTDLSAMDCVVKYAELEPTIVALNTLLQRLRSKITRERQFIHHVGKNLRAPISEVSSHVKTLMQASSEPERQLAERRIDATISDASRLIQQCLEMARLDELRHPEQQSVDCAQLLRDELAEMVAQAMDRQIDLSLEAPAALILKLNRNAFHLLSQKLIWQALHNTNSGGAIVVALAAQGPGLLLSVADDGASIAGAKRASMIRGLVADKEQALLGDALDMMMVRQAVQLLGGTIEVTKGLHDEGARFCVMLTGKTTQLAIEPPARSP